MRLPLWLVDGISTEQRGASLYLRCDRLRILFEVQPVDLCAAGDQRRIRSRESMSKMNARGLPMCSYLSVPRGRRAELLRRDIRRQQRIRRIRVELPSVAVVEG